MTSRKSAHLMQAGEELEPLEFVVTPELNQQYLYAEEDFHPRYIERSSFGPPLVHAGLLLNMSNNTRSPSFYLDPRWGSIHAGEEMEFINPCAVGDRLRVTWSIAQVYTKRGKPYQVIDTLIADSQGRPVLRRQIIATFSTLDPGQKE